MPITEVWPAEMAKPDSEEDPDKMPSNCTFTLADGSQFTTNWTYIIDPQPVTAVSCPPLDTAQEEELSPTTTTSFTYSSVYPFSESTIDVAATTLPYPTTQEESFITTASFSSFTISAVTTPSYTTTQGA